MAKLLYIKGSPRQERSKSNAAAEQFIEEYQNNNPEDEILTHDIFDIDLPAFDGPAIQAKYNIMHGEDHTNEQKQAWSLVEKIIDEFKSADKYVFSVPMWNFGIPYRLKQYFDVITQPSYTFTVDDKKGYVGLVTGKPAMLVFARGGDYSDTEKEKMLDHQKSYMELILGFIGFEDIKFLVIQPTLAGGPEIAKEKLNNAKSHAQEMAKSF